LFYSECTDAVNVAIIIIIIIIIIIPEEYL